jgi:peptidase E
MTTYILHGGATSKDLPENNSFFQQFTRHIPNTEVRILMCYFARDQKDWPALFKRDRSKVLKHPNKKVHFSVPQDPQHLLKLLPDHDVLYVAAGYAEPLESTYSMLQGLENLIQGKVCIGSSMGAFMMCSNYILSFDTQKSTEVHEGLGLLPLNLLCHWDIESRKPDKLACLAKTNSPLPTLTLNEGQWTTFYQ